MEGYKSDSKRLAKNILMLYIRTFFVMVISLFTSRVVLQSLGVENYGIYNIVGGFVSFFSIVSGTLVSTTQRFITFELGKKEHSEPQKVFGAAMAIHIILAIFLLLLFETIGLWLLNNKLNIPPERLAAANWVYQFSIAAFIVNIISTPYMAVIIAHERMGAFAYISVIEVTLKLVIVYALYWSPLDILVMYAILLFLVALLIRMIYNIYCTKHFIETKLLVVRDKDLYKSMFSFAGMNFMGSFASILAYQGVDIILNLFFGVVINAARGIANQVLGAVGRFTTDFMTALNPQITKEYAVGNKEQSKQLCFRGAKVSFFLMLLLATPIIFRTPQILNLWLGEYPEYAVVFIRCAFLLSMLSLLSNTLITEILATGNLTSTTWWIGGVRLLTLPLVYLCFRIGGGPEYAYFSLIGIEFLSLYIRLIILERISGIKFILEFTIAVVIRVLVVLLLVFIVNYKINSWFSFSFIGLCSYVIISMLISTIIISLLGMTNNERGYLLGMIKRRIHK